MIYRKWSLLTGPATILAGVMGTVAVGTLLFAKNDSLLKPAQRKLETLASKN